MKGEKGNDLANSSEDLEGISDKGHVEIESESEDDGRMKWEVG